jgi:hypothetical protein
MLRRVCELLKPYVIAVLIVTSFYTALPYLIRQYSAFQNRILVRGILERLEERRKHEDGQKLFQDPANLNEQPWILFSNVG